MRVYSMSANYRIIEKKVTGDIHVHENSQYNNLHAETVTVEQDVTVRLFGSISNKLTIKKGARVYLHGSLAGTLDNLGGEFFKY